MAQVYIRNNRNHDIILNSGSAQVTIPRGEQGPAGFAPGYKRVDASFIEEARKNMLVRGYFDEGCLAIEETPEQREKAVAEAVADEQAAEAKRKAAAEAQAKADREKAEAEEAQRKADEEKAQADAAQKEADDAAAAGDEPAPAPKGGKKK